MTEEVSNEVSSSVESTGSSHVTTTNIEYRQYGAYDAEGHIVGAKAKKVKKEDGTFELITETGGNSAILSETQTKKNWEEAEKGGATIINRNQLKFYTLVDEAGFSSLVKDPTQRAYIIQKGLDALQTAAANRYTTALEEKKEKSDPDVPLYNEETIDLLEAINKPPEKKNLSPEEKFMRAVSVIDPSKLTDMIEMLKKQLEMQAASQAS